MWFKKKAYISGYNSNTAVDGRDWRTDSHGSSWNASWTLPSAADANKYFYLPALGYYTAGRLSAVGSHGFYWSSSASSSYSYYACYLYFYNTTVEATGSSRGYGLRVGGLE